MHMEAELLPDSLQTRSVAGRGGKLIERGSREQIVGKDWSKQQCHLSLFEVIEMHNFSSAGTSLTAVACLTSMAAWASLTESSE